MTKLPKENYAVEQKTYLTNGYLSKMPDIHSQKVFYICTTSANLLILDLVSTTR